MPSLDSARGDATAGRDNTGRDTTGRPARRQSLATEAAQIAQSARAVEAALLAETPSRERVGSRPSAPRSGAPLDDPFLDLFPTAPPIQRGPAGPPPRPPAPPGGGSGRGRQPRKPRKAKAVILLSLAVALILVAVGVGGYPFYTDVMAARHQKTLRAQLAKDGGLSGAERDKLLQEYKNRVFANGSPITRLVIPKLNVDTIVVEGTDDQALAVGAGHYPQSPLPGDVGNVAIAGHRTMNGHPFGDLDKLAPGDQIILQTPFAQYTYQVVPAFAGHADPWVTTPEDWTVISFPTQDHLLTLTTCNPKGQKTQRLIARATLVGTQNET